MPNSSNNNNNVNISFTNNNNNINNNNSSYTDLHSSTSRSPGTRRNHNHNINISSSSSISGYFDQDGNYCGNNPINKSPNRIQFANVDPTYGNDEAAEEIFRIENGVVAREITKRLCIDDLEARAKRMEALKAKHAHHKRVPVRSDEEVNNYIDAMIQKADERRKRGLMKIAREMYPEPNPRLSEKSKELAEKYRERQEQKERIRAKMITKEQKKLEKILEHNPNLEASPAQILNKIVEKRHHGHSFVPAPHVDENPRIYLVSAPTPKVPPSSLSPHRAATPSTETERQQRFIALSQPRDYQKSVKKNQNTSSTSSSRMH